MNAAEPKTILIVEDSDEDFAATQWAFAQASVVIPVVRCKDGEEAIDYLERRGKYSARDSARAPAIILLDLNLPRTTGYQVLKYIKSSERLKLLPVVVVTSSRSPDDIQTCFQSGSNSYVVKPLGIAKLRELVHGLVEYWFRLSQLPDLIAIDED